MSLEERIDQLEFQAQPLYDNSKVDEYLAEQNIAKAQYTNIMDLMESMRQKLGAGEEVKHYTYERRIYDIVPSHDGDYHFCESLAKLFAEDGRWDEVFPALYGDMPKYGGKVK